MVVFAYRRAVWQGNHVVYGDEAFIEDDGFDEAFEHRIDGHYVVFLEVSGKVCGVGQHKFRVLEM